jgi:hypothetical protein
VLDPFQNPSLALLLHFRAGPISETANRQRLKIQAYLTGRGECILARLNQRRRARLDRTDSSREANPASSSSCYTSVSGEPSAGPKRVPSLRCHSLKLVD